MSAKVLGVGFVIAKKYKGECTLVEERTLLELMIDEIYDYFCLFQLGTLPKFWI